MKFITRDIMNRLVYIIVYFRTFRCTASINRGIEAKPTDLRNMD